MARSKLENALYESFVKGDLAKPAQTAPGQMGMTQSVQQRSQYDDGGAAQLVKALSSFSGELQRTIGSEADRNNIKQREEAHKKYLSMSVDEREKLISSGQLQQFDPVFNAAYSRLWGEDVVRKSMDETMTKLKTGELQFHDDAEGTADQKLEQYLVEKRKTDLANYGGNEFAVSGYDAYFNHLRQEANATNTALRGREKRQASATLSQSKLLAVAKESGANPEALAKNYRELQQRFVFSDNEMHTMMTEVAQSLAHQGKNKELEALLGTQFSKNAEFGTLGNFLGDKADLYIKEAKRVDMTQRKDAFEGTYANLLQASTEGRLNQFVGSRKADVNSVYAYLEKQGVKDVFSPEQVAGLVNHHNNAVEREQAKAERGVLRAQMAQMKAQMQGQAMNQALQFGRAGVTDQVTTDANGVTHVVSADTLYKQAALNYTANIDKAVANKQLTPEQAFVKKREFFARGGVNEGWKDTMSFGVEAAAQVVANPNDKGARQTFDNALKLYGDLKGSATPWLADNHVTGKAKDVLNLALMAQARGQDPATVVANAMNSVEERKVTYKDVSKVVKDERLAGQVMDTAEMYARGLKMSIKDAIAKAKEDLTNYYPKVNGVAVPPITRNITPDKQEAALNSIVGKVAKEVSQDAAGITLDTFNQASGFYTMRYKNGFAPVLDKNHQPIVISKDEIYKEVAFLDDAELKKHTSKAIPEDRGAGFTKSKPINLSSNYGLDNVKLPSLGVPDANFNDVASPNLGVPRNKR